MVLPSSGMPSTFFESRTDLSRRMLPLCRKEVRLYSNASFHCRRDHSFAASMHRRGISSGDIQIPLRRLPAIAQ